MKTIRPLAHAIRVVAAVCSALAIFVVNDAAGQSIPGMSVGSFKVTNSGSAQYSIPVLTTRS